MISPARARLLAAALLAVLVFALTYETARGSDWPVFKSGQSGHAGPPVVDAIRQEFGTGTLGGCFAAIAWRETRYDARAANWTDVHADGSRGSFGALQIGALWRRPGESVAAFARRMYDPRANAALAHRLYRLYGLTPWGNRCD